jgi:hypothetical protein
MQLLTDDRVPVGEVEHREGAGLELFFGVLLTAAALGSLLLPLAVPELRAAYALVPLIVIAGSLAFMGRFGLAGWAASRRPESWLVRRDGDAVYLRFRSPRNWRFDAATPSVVGLGGEDILWVRPLVRSLREPGGETGWTSTIRVKHVELGLSPRAGLEGLRAALAEETARRDARGARVNHRPVSISPGATLLLEAAHPGRLCAAFADVAEVRPRVEVEAREFATMSAAERRAHATELARAGRTVSAAVALDQAQEGTVPG